MRSISSIVLHPGKSGSDPNQILLKLALRNALKGCESVLDVGCGTSPIIRELGIGRSVGVDGYLPSVEKARALGSHHEVIHSGFSELRQRFKPGEVDACVALDVIEHLTKDEGYRLMETLEIIARRCVIFLTPNGFLPQNSATPGDLQAHLSGWTPSEMRKQGYQVTGLLGPKMLRGSYHRLKWQPTAFWAGISIFAQLGWSYRHPESAAAILCRKTKLSTSDVRTGTGSTI